MSLRRKLFIFICLLVAIFGAFKLYRHYFPPPPEPLPPPLAGTSPITVKGSVTPNTPLKAYFWYHSESDQCSHYESNTFHPTKSSGYFRDDRWFSQSLDTGRGEYAFSFPVRFSLNNCEWELWAAYLLYTKYAGEKYVDISDMKVVQFSPLCSTPANPCNETLLNLTCEDGGFRSLFYCKSKDGRDLKLEDLFVGPLVTDFVINIEVGPAPKFCPETGQWSTLPCEKTPAKNETTF